MLKKLALLIVVPLLINTVAIYAYEKPTEIRVSINNTEINTPCGELFSLNQNEIYVPLRDIAEALYFTVSYDQKLSAAVVSKDGAKLTYPIGEQYYLKNGTKFNLSSKIISRDGRIYIDVKSLVKSFGETVTILENKDKTITFIDIYSLNNNFNARFSKVTDVIHTTNNNTDLYNTDIEVSENSITISNLNENNLPALVNIITGITKRDDIGNILASEIFKVWQNKDKIVNQETEITKKKANSSVDNDVFIDDITTYTLNNNKPNFMGNIVYGNWSGYGFKYVKTGYKVIFTIVQA